MQSLSMCSAKNAMSSARSSSTARKRYLRKSSARSALSVRSAKAISGSIIQNSARWRRRVRVLGAERRPEGVDPRERQAVGLDVELARDGEARRLAEEVGEKSTAPWSSRGRLARSSVETRNIAPAPSASLVVMIGVWTQKKPCSWKYRCTAIDRQSRTRATAPNVLVRGRRWATVAQVLDRVPLGRDRVTVRVLDPADHLDRSALTSNRCPLPCDSISVPATLTAQWVVRWRISVW